MDLGDLKIDNQVLAERIKGPSQKTPVNWAFREDT
jgi:hypothetical protein